MLHRLHKEQLVKASLTEVWDFFSNPKNLECLTPKDIGFEITQQDSETMHAGQIIAYKIQLLPLCKVTWVTEITQVEENVCFIDNQVAGPYKIWHHRHTFKEVEQGVLMTDTVHYMLPFGILGSLVHALFVKRKLESIFDYRIQAVDEYFQ